jgi:hypothetical protein
MALRVIPEELGVSKNTNNNLGVSKNSKNNSNQKNNLGISVNTRRSKKIIQAEVFHSEGSISHANDREDKYDISDHERALHMHHGTAKGHGKGHHHHHHGLNAHNMEVVEALDEIGHKHNHSAADIEQESL